MKPAIVIPTLNEKDTLERLVLDIVKNVPGEFLIVIVDDQSSDGTQEIIRRLESEYTNIFGIVRGGARSFAQSYIQGFQCALSKGATHCVEMDADGSHRVLDLVDIIQKLHAHPVVIGSRYCQGGKTLNWPLSRKLLSRGGNIFARMTTGIPLSDITSGFVGYSKSVLDRIAYASITCEGYSFQVEMKWLCYRAYIPLYEFPITFIEREQGYSKMSSKIVREAMLFCIKKMLRK